MFLTPPEPLQTVEPSGGVAVVGQYEDVSQYGSACRVPFVIHHLDSSVDVPDAMRWTPSRNPKYGLPSGNVRSQPAVFFESMVCVSPAGVMRRVQLAPVVMFLAES